MAGVSEVRLTDQDKEILRDVEFFKDRYFTFDDPVPIKDGLTLYPVTVRNYMEFLSCSSCLTLDRLSDTRQGIKTNLGFLLWKMADEKEGPLWYWKFSQIADICFHVKNGLMCQSCGKIFPYSDITSLQPDSSIMEHLKVGKCPDCDGKISETIAMRTDKEALLIGGVEVDGKLFSKIRKYIMYQNLPDYRDDSLLCRELREDYAKKQEIMARKQQGNATLERKICCLAAKSNYKIPDICDMPMRKFEMLLGVINDAMEYEAERVGLMTGLVSLEKGKTLNHWIYKHEDGPWGKAMDLDAYTGQFK